MQQTVWENVFIQTLKLEAKAFLYLPGMDFTNIM